MRVRPRGSAIVAAACLAVFPRAATAQNGRFLQDAAARPGADAVEQAQQALRLAVDERTYGLMGFRTRDEVRSAILGIPAPVYMVPLDDLRAFRPGGDDPIALLLYTAELVYPVLVSGRTRAELVLRRQEDGSWTVSSIGAPNHARLFSDIRARRAEADGLGASDYVEVRVPALNVSFVGVLRDGRLRLAPLLDDPRFDFVQGDPLPADEALGRMVPAARAHEGLPG